ncbi:MAG TPA: homoserine O-acetyltransferase [Lentimicrobium sp.]|nr:homoserine O-acetyltransferase [Lentimicrobium sp.]
MQSYKHQHPFITESGETINGLTIGYHTYGKLSESGNNVIWICHALTANSDSADWWPGMVGEGKCFDSAKYFIVCANVLGSCYGTTGPLAVNPDTGRQWLHNFPEITIRDIVRVNDLLRVYLGIKAINLVIGGSIGGFQSMEWAIMQPELFKHLVLIACSAKASPWVIAFNESQRLALMADNSFSRGYYLKDKIGKVRLSDDSGTDSEFIPNERDGLEGLKAARSIALISYRTSKAYNLTQAEKSDNKISNFRASSYQQYQGDKLVKRFNAYSYYVLTRFIDSHNIYRGRPDINILLKKVKAKTLVIGISTDILYPVSEQHHLAGLFPNAEYKEIYSEYGHDGFLIESDQLTKIIEHFTSECISGQESIK